jgi:hypothetical protein
MLDAEQFGYKRWPPENERRRSTQQ